MFQMSMHFGLLDAEQAEPVEVGEELLAEVVVGPEDELAERRLEVVGVGDEPGPVEDRDRAQAEDVLPGVDPPGQVLGRVAGRPCRRPACPVFGFGLRCSRSG